MGRIPGLAEIQLGPSPYTEPKPWHGDLMAALSKAFKAVGTTPLAFPAEVRDKLMQLSILYGTNNQLLKSRLQRQPAMDSEDRLDSPRQSRRLGPKTRPSRVEAELIPTSEHHCHQNDGEVHQMGSKPKAHPQAQAVARRSAPRYQHASES